MNVQLFNKAVISAMKRGIGCVDKSLFYTIHQKISTQSDTAIPHFISSFTTAVYHHKNMSILTYHRTVTEFLRIFLSEVECSGNQEVTKTKSKTKQSNKAKNLGKSKSSTPSSGSSTVNPPSFQKYPDKPCTSISNVKTVEEGRQALASSEVDGSINFNFSSKKKISDATVYRFGEDESVSAEQIHLLNGNSELLITDPSEIDQMIQQIRSLRQEGSVANQNPLSGSQCDAVARNQQSAEYLKLKAQYDIAVMRNNIKEITRLSRAIRKLQGKKPPYIFNVVDEEDRVIGVQGTVRAGDTEPSRVITVKRVNDGSITGVSTSSEASVPGCSRRKVKGKKKKQAQDVASFSTSFGG